MKVCASEAKTHPFDSEHMTVLKGRRALGRKATHSHKQEIFAQRLSVDSEHQTWLAS